MYNRLLPCKSSFTKEKNENGRRTRIPAVSKIEVSKVETEEKEIERKQELEISNVVELETGKQEEVKQEKEVPKKQMSMPVENVNVKAVVAVLILGMFVSILNQTIINVALPPLMNEFNVSTSTAQWLVTGFMLVNGILVPISAFLVSRFTYRKLFVAAMLFFTVRIYHLCYFRKLYNDDDRSRNSSSWCGYFNAGWYEYLHDVIPAS